MLAVKDKKGRTPLEFAQERNHEEVVARIQAYQPHSDALIPQFLGQTGAAMRDRMNYTAFTTANYLGGARRPRPRPPRDPRPTARPPPHREECDATPVAQQ